MYPLNAFPHSMSGVPLTHIALDVLLVMAAVIDWRTYRLPNWLTMGGTLVAYMLSLTAGGIGIVDSVVGWAIGLVLMLPLYGLRMTGAGDVKLMAMVGAFLGLPDVLFALLLTMIAGGIAAVAFAAWRRNVSRMVVNARDLLQLTAMAAAHGQRPSLGSMPSVGKLPYGICVCIGTFAWLAWVHVR